MTVNELLELLKELKELGDGDMEVVYAVGTDSYMYYPIEEVKIKSINPHRYCVSEAEYGAVKMIGLD